MPTRSCRSSRFTTNYELCDIGRWWEKPGAGDYIKPPAIVDKVNVGFKGKGEGLPPLRSRCLSPFPEFLSLIFSCRTLECGAEYRHPFYAYPQRLRKPTRITCEYSPQDFLILSGRAALPKRGCWMSATRKLRRGKSF
jgi:hypothetical protein